MSTPIKQMDQVAATHHFSRAFNFNSNPAETALAIFPTRVTADNSQDASEVNNSLLRIKQSSSKLYRSLQSDIEKARNSELRRPDTVLKFLFRCRKNHVYYESGKYDRNEYQVQATENYPSSSPSIPIVHNGGSPASPFLRRAASRDPVYFKVKEEMPSPSPLSQVNGPVNQSRSRSQIRSRSLLTSESLSPTIKSSLSTQSSPYNQVQNSIEKTSASNPLYFNVQQGTPLRPGMRTKEEVTMPVSGKPPRLPRDLPPYPGKPLWARTGAPPTVPADTFFRELRGALGGIKGMYFTNDGGGSLTISRSCSLSDAMHTAVQDLLNAGNTFIHIRKQISRFEHSDIVKQVIIEAVRSVMDKYFTDIGDLTFKTASKNAIQILVSRTLPWHLRLNVMKRCLEYMNEADLSLQDEVYSLWKACQGTDAEIVMDVILEAALGVFCNTLRMWINHGELINSNWIIQEVSNDVGFKVIYRPSFVNGIVLDNILKIGISQPFVGDQDLEKMESFRSLVEAYVTPDNLATADGRSKINRICLGMADWLGGKVINQLMEEGHFMQHLTAARKFLLLDDAHFAMALHKCIQKMTVRTLQLSRDEALTAFVTAIKQSPAAKLFPFRVVIDTLVSPNSTPVGSARSQFIQSIHPLMRVTGLAEKAFKGTQTSYETLFHFLWSLQTALYFVENAGVRLRYVQREITSIDELLRLHRLMSAVCTRFLRIFLAIRQYSLVVISQSCSRFHAHLTDANDIESVADQHQFFLNELQSALFCDQENEKISTLIGNMVQMAYTFSRKSVQFEEDIANYSSPDTSESILEFERTEKAISFDQIKTEVMAVNRTFKVAFDDMQNELAILRERAPLVAIILHAQ